jgi:hypothetical protein
MIVSAISTFSDSKVARSVFPSVLWLVDCIYGNPMDCLQQIPACNSRESRTRSHKAGVGYARGIRSGNNNAFHA